LSALTAKRDAAMLEPQLYIYAYTKAFLGQLTDQNGNPLTIDGLWGIMFGNGGQAGMTNELFFSAGLNDEADGLFGKITAQ
jgi:hypothetical protein